MFDSVITFVQMTCLSRSYVLRRAFFLPSPSSCVLFFPTREGCSAVCILKCELHDKFTALVGSTHIIYFCLIHLFKFLCWSFCPSTLCLDSRMVVFIRIDTFLTAKALFLDKLFEKLCLFSNLKHCKNR